MAEETGTTAEIIAIGNELLIGQTLDTNTNWLCKQITGLGGRVRRAVMVPDDFRAIARELHTALDRGTDLIVTTGGLGPTSDDLTLEALARALGRALVEDSQALAMVEQRYNELYEQGLVDRPGLTEARRKMASLPEGATPLFNPVGGAPGIVLRVEGTAIVALPGVPQELKGIWRESLTPVLEELFDEGAYVEVAVYTDTPDDSVLAPYLDAVVERHPEVYIKSHVKAFGSGERRIRVTFSMAGSSRQEVESAVQAAIQDLTDKLAQDGFRVEPGR